MSLGLPENGFSQKDSIRRALDVIKRECADVMHTRREVFWSYKRLAGFTDADPEDWKGEGYLRRLIQGHRERQWLIAEYQLFHRADMEKHAGIFWTCNPLVGSAWENERKRNAVAAACDHCQAVASLCATIQPRQNLYFTKMSERWGQLGQHTRKVITPGHLRLAAPYDEAG